MGFETYSDFRVEKLTNNQYGVQYSTFLNWNENRYFNVDCLLIFALMWLCKGTQKAASLNTL